MKYKLSLLISIGALANYAVADRLQEIEQLRSHCSRLHSQVAVTTCMTAVQIESQEHEIEELKKKLNDAQQAAIPQSSSIEVKVYVDAQNLLHKAILNDSAEEVRSAVLAGANVNAGKDGKAPLIVAVALKRSRAIDELINCGADVNVKYSGRSLVHYSAISDDIKSVILLVKNGANFSGNLDQTRNIMDYAILRNSLELAQELINHGWDISNATDGYVGGNSLNAKITNVLWLAIPRGSAAMVRLFIANGANPNQIIYSSGHRGASWTPLLIAVDMANKETVNILLDSGADINQKASPFRHQIETHSPLSLAIQLGKSELVELLMMRGAIL